MYKLNPWGLVELADGDRTLVIPADPQNADYRRYQEWLAAGNQPAPADPLPDPEPPRDRKIRGAFRAAREQVAAASTLPQLRAAHLAFIDAMAPLFGSDE